MKINDYLKCLITFYWMVLDKDMDALSCAVIWGESCADTFLKWLTNRFI